MTPTIRTTIATDVLRHRVPAVIAVLGGCEKSRLPCVVFFIRALLSNRAELAVEDLDLRQRAREPRRPKAGCRWNNG